MKILGGGWPAGSRAFIKKGWGAAGVTAVGALGLLAGVLCGVSSAAARDHRFEILYNFADNGDGGHPLAGLFKDSAGNLYGTTFSYNGASSGGSVFRLAPDGTETVLYKFNGADDGGYPYSSVIEDKAGNFYGTTSQGGHSQGVVFKLSPNGTEKVLHAFSGGDGSAPLTSLLRDKNGNLFGTTSLGGGGDCFLGCGVVFKIAKNGTAKVLYAFTGGADGASPGVSDSLIADKLGNLYGTTSVGGLSGAGVVFKLAPDGAETVLYSFKGGSDGALPQAGVVEDKAGNLYGTTYSGGGSGCGGGCGTVFKLAPDGIETVLYSFCSQTNCYDGGFPQTGLVLDKAGNLYGTSSKGGTGGCINGCGTVFKLAPNGVETVLHSFTVGTDSNSPNGLIQDSADEKGDLFGTTQTGGTYGAGTVFKLRK